MIGKMLGNRYEILEQLGGGGMAIVFKGRDIILNRMVAIKLLRPEYTSDDDFVKRFSREAQSVACLSHPNIVSIYDVGRENDMHYLVMEYVDGLDLRSIIKQEGLLQPSHVVKIARQVCDALEHAHDNNIVHRDVKPHNILITKSGRAKLTDFGIAREAGTATVTSADTLVGSVHYLSPEQARGEAAGPKSDIYSLGVVLYEMLTGSVPFSGDSHVSIALKHIQNDPEPLAEKNPAVPEDLSRVVMRALNKDPSLRFKSAGEMSYQLEEALNGDDGDTTRIINVSHEKMQSLKNSVRQPAAGPKKTKKKLNAAGWTAAVLLAIMVLGGFYYGYHKYVNVPEVAVPNVVGKIESEAINILRENKLDHEIRRDFSPTVAKGYVIEQEPVEGLMVKENRTVILIVSEGPEFKVVPDLFNMILSDARTKLFEAGFVLSEPVKEEFNQDVEKDRVISQSAPANTPLIKGSEIKLVVSKGPEPVEQEIPDLRGLTVEQAKNKLAERNLQLDDHGVTHQYNTEFMRGQVILQAPEAGEKAPEGTAVKVVVSSGPGPTAREATVRVDNIPNDGKMHEVKISVTDVTGTNEKIINQKPGQPLEEPVRYWGRATIRVYLDGKLVRERTLE